MAFLTEEASIKLRNRYFRCVGRWKWRGTFNR